MKKKPELGRQARHELLRTFLASLITKREPQEVIVVHHYTDTKSKLQLEVERRSKEFGLAFERIIL